jgi:hypothetical protein
MSISTSGGPSVPAGDGRGSPWARASAGDATTGQPLAGAGVDDDDPDEGGPPPTAPSSSRTLLWFGVAAGGALVAGVVVILVLVTTGFFGGSTRSGVGPFGALPAEPSRPPLARLCPPPSDTAPAGESVPVPEGPRVTDVDAGISYTQLGAPWKPWDRGTWKDGTLGVEFKQGYYIVTETYSEGQYLASVISGKVPATVGDSLSLDLECAGRQVAEDVRNSYYPRPNEKEQTRNERITVGGRPAWVSTFHLTFQATGLQARGETVAVVLVDVGRPDAGVLYISIPDTHQQLKPEIDKIIASIRRI